MNIQNNTGVNFGAKRILNIRNSKEVVDVFALNKNDKKFIERFYYTAGNSDKDITSNPRNKNYMIGANIQKRDFLECLRGFLRNAKNKSMDDTSYVLAVKNGDTITGIAEADQSFLPLTNLKRAYFTQQDGLAEDGLLYGLITETKSILKKESKYSGKLAHIQGAPEFVGGGNIFKINSVKNKTIPVSKYNSIQQELKRRHPETEFINPKDKHEYDLEEFLDIKDIETEINPSF